MTRHRFRNDSSCIAGKSCLVTGGTAGIGFVTARELVRMGASVTIVGRNIARGDRALTEIKAATDRDSIDFMAADLSDQSQLRAFAVKFHERRPRLDVLINNAGGLFGQRRLSADAIELTFALNHLNYFLLTHLLLPALRAGAPSRIVNVASEAHRGVSLDFDNLQGEVRYNRWLAYKRSKLANLLFTYELSRRLAGHAITVNALHPGFVATNIGVRHGFVPGILWRIGKLFAIDVEEGAATSIHLASAPEVAQMSGQYFIEGHPARSSAASYDQQAGLRLWEVSANLTNVAVYGNS
jgi:NAD(P)-dependent dehydrogenase (short-subunit alcohol dehydrogenase family)